MANTQVRAFHRLGFTMFDPGQVTQTSAINAAATWIGLQFVPSESKTLSAVRLYQVTQVGTNVAADITCSIYSSKTDGTGLPNALIAGPVNMGAGGAAATWQTWSGFSLAVTAGTPYWIVIKNVNAAPATNYPTFNTSGGDFGQVPTYASNLNGWNHMMTADSGTTWATNSRRNVAGPRVAYNDSTYDGLPVSDVSSIATASGVYANREVGNRFTAPAVGFNAFGIGVGGAFSTGTPTGNLRARLYANGILLATSFALPVANVPVVANYGYHNFYFSSSVLIPANADCRMVISETSQADVNTKAFRLPEITWDTDTNSLALKPFNGTMQATVTADATVGPPPTWTDTSNKIYPMYLIGTWANEFTNAASASGGGSGFTLATVERGTLSNIFTVPLTDSSSGGPLTGLTNASAGLTIEMRRQLSATKTTYTGANLLTVTTLGTFANPTANTQIRIRETDEAGVYEVQVHDTATNGFGSGDTSAYVDVKIYGATNLVTASFKIPLIAPVSPITDVWNPAVCATRLLSGPTNVLSGSTPLTVDANGRVDVSKIGGVIQTARDLGASVLLSPGTGAGQVDLATGQVKVQPGTLAGQLDITAGVVKSNTVQVGGTVQTARDLGASVLLSPGTGAGQLDLTTGQVKVQSGTGAGQLNVTGGVIQASLVASGLAAILVESGITASLNLVTDSGAQPTAITLPQAVSVVMSVVAAVLQGANTNTPSVRPLGKPLANSRVSWVTDATGRTSVTVRVPD